ncbi:MAG TPA: M48 family metalloprotease [Thermoanaerobaculia bacterium]|nr:M48 family metalloprotease [Thermoanaerobaculia bacterium]
MRMRFAVLAVVLSLCSAVSAETLEEFDARIERELGAKDAQALVLWKQANAARDADRAAEAIALYAQVVQRVPAFDHALRRQASVEAQTGKPKEAVAHARQALELDRSPLNMSAVAFALLSDGNASDEAATLATEASNLRPDDENTQQVLAAIAAERKDLDMLRLATVRLESAAPKSTSTHMYRMTLAVNEGDYGEAHMALDRAKAFGLPPGEYDKAAAWIDSAKPFYLRWWKPVAFAVLAWIGGFGLMLVTGAILSRMALRAAETTDEMSAKVRRLYAIVLGASCAFYYASIPIVIGFVLALSGVLLYATFSLERVPIKLVIFLVVGAAVSVWSIIKSLFIRPSNDDPGVRLDLSQEPKLRQLLDTVAAKIGTGAVDNVYMTPSTDMAVMERGKGRRRERCLILGIAALEGLRVRPFKAILGHEYGHFTNRDTAGGAFALAVRRSLGVTAMGLAEGGVATWYNPAWWFVNAFHRLFLRISEGASRLQEVLADRWAVVAYGADAFEEGLRHIIERSVRFDAHASATINEVVNKNLPLANLYTFSPATAGDDVTAAIEEALSAKSSVYDSHPAPSERFALTRRLPHQYIAREPDDDSPSSSLFTNFEALQVRMTAQVRENVKANIGVEIAAPAAG